MRRLAFLGAVAAGLGIAPVAAADHWPVAGGGPARSSNAASSPGSVPISGAWRSADGRVVTPVTISGGGGPDVQRVTYATADGRVHLRVLATGAPVGPPEGILIDSGTLVQDDELYGPYGTVGFADTSTEDRLGQLLVPHNDDSFGTPKVFVARIRLDTGEVLADDIVPGGASDCETASAPLLTPPAAGGGRLLYFMMQCSRALSRYLVRVPIQGDAASPSATLGAAGFALVPDAVEAASPALMVLADAAGAPRFHVAVARRGGLTLFEADDPLDDGLRSAEHPSAIRAELQAPEELPRTPAVPTTASGTLAGADGSGTRAAPAVYVAADAAGTTKVYRLVQDGQSRVLRVDRVAALGEGSGAPSPALAVAETATPSGLSPGGTLVVNHAANVTMLRTGDLSRVGSLSNVALPAGSGFGRTAPAVSGAFAFLVRDGSIDRVPEHLAVRLDGLAPLAQADFARVEDKAPGQVGGQPAVSRGHVVFGTASGVLAYRTRDTAAPAVSLLAPAADAELAGVARLVARATDPGGIQSVAFRISTDGGSSRTIGTVGAPDAGSAFGAGSFSFDFPTAAVSNGTYLIEAVATDGAGNAATSERRRVRIANPGRSQGLPPGACANPLSGSGVADRITGSTAGDRILGGAGDDRLDGAAGHDCVLGQDGDDIVAGGTGDDLLEGGGGEDVLAGGAGRNRLDGGAGADVARGGAAAEELTGGAGDDTILAGRGNDRVLGGSGDDSLKGEAGNDRISGGAGRDAIAAGGGSNRIDGGSGNDRISAVNGKRDVIACGRGRDRVVADRRDRVSRSCERVTRRGR